jgi:hypothetical protein
MISTYGNPADAGGRIFDTENGSYFEYTDGQLYCEGDTLLVWGTFLERDVFTQFERLLPRQALVELCRGFDLPVETWLKRARGTLLQRAGCICDIAEHFEWAVIDSEPLELSPAELHMRWYTSLTETGPVVSIDAAPAIVAFELLIVLYKIDTDRYWKLLTPLFPIVPSEALQNPQCPWWAQHGAEAIDTLTKAIQSACPPLYEFSVREEQYGFWKRITP